MRSFDDCEKAEDGHDYRRLWKRDLNPDTPVDQDSVLAVVCCRCGCSPIRSIRAGTEQPRGNPSGRVNGEWPEGYRVSAYYNDATEGPSVEFFTQR